MNPKIIVSAPTAVFSDPDFDFNFPSLACLTGGDILCLARKITYLNDPKGELVMARSTDGGKTFERVPHPNTADAKAHPEWGFLLGFVAETAPGKLTSVYEYVETDESKPLFSPVTDGMQQAYIRCTFSNDNGCTWEEARDIGFKLPDIIVPSQPYLMPDGSVSFGTETHDVWENGYAAKGSESWLIVSRDGGRTYDEGILIAAREGTIHGDIRITFDGDETIAYYWLYDVVNNTDLPVHKCVSFDSGRTWCKPYPLDLHTQITSPFFVKKGLTMCLAQDRFGEDPGLKAMLSYDEGATWDGSSTVHIYDAGSSPDGANPFAQFEQYKFGYSSLRRLSENEAICVYWNEVNGRKVISINRIKVEY